MSSISSDPDLSIEAFLGEVKRRVDEHLARFFEQKRQRARSLSTPSLELVDALAEFTMRGGKRTRPAVLIAGHMAASASTSVNALLDASGSLELLQSYLLVHDDWMDQDDARRGGPALHKLFGDRANDRHMGASLAVLAGDLGNAFAIELLASAEMPESRRVASMRVFWEMQQDVVYGQALDLIAYDDVALIERLKTGSYTVRGPLLLGAVIGGASDAQKRALDRFADPVGQAFQVRDDFLGTFGDPEKTGKPRGNDLRAGKRTAIVEEAEKRISAEDFAPVRAVLGKADASESAIVHAIELIERCGAKKAIEERIGRLCGEAESALQDSVLVPLGVQRLRELARLFAYRDR